MAEREVGIRIGTTGKAEVKTDFAEVQKAGTDAMQGIAQEADRTATASERAAQRQVDAWKRQAAAAKVAAVAGANQQAFNSVLGVSAPKATDNGAGYSALAALVKQEDERAAAIARVKAALDPLTAAQAKYDAELALYSAALARGELSAEEYAGAVALSGKTLAAARTGVDGFGEAHGRASTSMLILQHVMRSTTDSIAAGLPVSMIAGEQMSRLGEAVALAARDTGEAESTFAKFAAVMAGPWGIAIQAGILALTTLVPLIVRSHDAKEDDRAATLTLADAVQKLDQVTGQAHKTHEQEVQDAYAAAAALYKQELQTRNLTKAKLEAALAEVQAKREESTAPSQRGENAALGAAADQNYAQSLQALLDKNNKDLAAAAAGFRGAIADRIIGQVADQFDAAAAATHRFKQQEADLYQQFKSGQITRQQFTDDIRSITIAKNNAIAATKQHRSALDDEGRAAQFAAEEQQKLLDSVMQLAAARNPDDAAYGLYQERMQNIQAMLRAGGIDADTATEAGQAAGKAFRDALEHNAEQRQREGAVRLVTPGLLNAPPLISEAQIKSDLASELDFMKAKIKSVNPALVDLQHVGEEALDAIFNPQNWTSWGDLGKHVLQDLEQEFIKLAALNPLKNLLFGERNPTLGSIGGLFGGIGGLFGGGAAAGDLSTGALLGLPGFASGTDDAPGGLAWVGENGKELVDLPRGSRVIPAPDSRRLLSAANDQTRITVELRMNTPLFTAAVSSISGQQAAAVGVRAAAGGSQMAQDAISRKQARAIPQ